MSFRKQQKYMATGIKLLPKHWHRGRVSARTDAILINQTLDKLVNDVRKVIYEMMEEGDIDIFTIPDRLNRMRVGNVIFLDYCEKRAEVWRFGKSADSKARYDRFMKKFREWGGIKDWADITEEKIIEFDKYRVQHFKSCGYRVGINTPFSNSKTFSVPTEYHTVMIEVNKKLYMNEDYLEKIDSFYRVKHDIQSLYQALLRC